MGLHAYTEKGARNMSTKHPNAWAHVFSFVIVLLCSLLEYSQCRASLVPRLSNYCRGGKESLVSIASAGQE